MMRKSAVSGQFYPDEKQKLLKELTDCFLDARGPGKLPNIRNGKQHIRGLVVPHAGYIYSGAIAAHAYYTLAVNNPPATYILLGPNHTGQGSGVSIMTEGIWETPLGTIPINTKLAQQLAQGIIDTDSYAHQYEHSIEVQLPFLQYILKDHPFDFAPICMSMQDSETVSEVGTIIATALQHHTKNITIIASSDFSHVGFNYQTLPPNDERVDRYATQQDKKALEQILAFNPTNLIDTIYQHHITMCGYGPVAAMLTAANTLGASHVELLKYGTSYEVQPSSSCVGYGALAVY
jgi:AmmeMemoRadiSam system protein B